MRVLLEQKTPHVLNVGEINDRPCFRMDRAHVSRDMSAIAAVIAVVDIAVPALITDITKLLGRVLAIGQQDLAHGARGEVEDDCSVAIKSVTVSPSKRLSIPDASTPSRLGDGLSSAPFSSRPFVLQMGRDEERLDTLRISLADTRPRYFRYLAFGSGNT